MKGPISILVWVLKETDYKQICYLDAQSQAYLLDS